MLLFLLLACSAALAETKLVFREHTIATDLAGGYQVVAADLNKDGRPDLIALASGMKELLWFENPGAGGGEWKRHVLATGLSRMINLAAADLDGDKIPEILVAHAFENQAKNSIGIVSFLDSKGDVSHPWTVREIDRLTTSHRIRTARIGGQLAFINAPLTGASAEPPDYRDSTPLVLYRPGVWKRETIGEENEGVVHGIFIHDWNRDDQDEILTASFLGLHLYEFKSGKWHRSELAKGDPAAWPKSGSSDVAVGFLKKKRFLAAIEPWHGNQVSVYTEKNGAWIRQVIDDKLVDGHTIVTADLNGDGRDEIVAGFRGEGRSVHIYRSQGDKWMRETLDNGGIAAAACTASDFNGDKKIDLACIGSATRNLKWYENAGSR